MSKEFTMEYPPEAGLSISPDDGSVAILLEVSETDRFDDVAGSAFALIKEAQDLFPDRARHFFLTIKGHVGLQHGFDLLNLR